MNQSNLSSHKPKGWYQNTYNLNMRFENIVILFTIGTKDGVW